MSRKPLASYRNDLWLRRLGALAVLAAGVGVLLLDSEPMAGQEPKAKPFADPEAAFKLADANKDGKLSKDEFEKLLANAPRLKENPKAADFLFNRLDENRDGFLTLEEFRRVRDVLPPR